MPPPGFEPGSRGRKPRILDLARRRGLDNINLHKINLKFLTVLIIFFNNPLKDLFTSSFYYRSYFTNFSVKVISTLSSTPS